MLLLITYVAIVSTIVIGIATLGVLTGFRLGRKGFVVDKKDVLVTGAARGIGRELAKRFAKEGARRLVLWDIDTRALEKTRIDITRNFPNVKVCVRTLDVGDSEDVRKAFDEVEDGGHLPSVVVNNAGTLSGKTFLQMEEKDVRRTIDTNLMAHF